MLLEFRTKTDINGNKKSILIDTEKKLCEYGYYTRVFTPITITSKQYIEIVEKLKKDGYKHI